MKFIYSYSDVMEIIEEIVKVGERGQIVIPAKIRKKEKIRSNSYLRVIDIEGRIVVAKVKVAPVKKIIDSLTSLELIDKDWDDILKARDNER